VMTTHYCIECGMALIVGARFCGNCGLRPENPAQSATKLSVPVVNSEVCPRCGQVDRVTKVSGIADDEFQRKQLPWPRSYSDHHSQNSDSGHHSKTTFISDESTVASTVLASRLTLPKPYEYRPFRTVIGCSMALTFLSVPFLFVGILTFILDGTGSVTSQGFIVPVILLVVAVTVVVVVVIVRDAVQGTKLRGRAAAEARCWPKRKSDWDKLYYCYRDDVVFSGGLSAPSLRMLEFLDGYSD
jgi:hypothetical protein